MTLQSRPFKRSMAFIMQIKESKSFLQATPNEQSAEIQPAGTEDRSHRGSSPAEEDGGTKSSQNPGRNQRGKGSHTGRGHNLSNEGLASASIPPASTTTGSNIARDADSSRSSQRTLRDGYDMCKVHTKKRLYLAVSRYGHAMSEGELAVQRKKSS